jgi:hypothetical protein
MLYQLTLGNCLMILMFGLASASSWIIAKGVQRQMGNLGYRERMIWQFQAILFFLLALNTALTVLVRLSALFRALAVSNDWYPDRMIFQEGVIVCLIGFGVVVASLGLYFARSTSWPAFFSLLASVVLVTFILVRAVSLHNVDRVLYVRFAGVTLSSAIEASWIGLILFFIIWRRAQMRAA